MVCYILTFSGMCADNNAGVIDNNDATEIPYFWSLVARYCASSSALAEHLLESTYRRWGFIALRAI